MTTSEDRDKALRAADNLIEFMEHKPGCKAPSGKPCSCGLTGYRHEYREARQATRKMGET